MALWSTLGDLMLGSGWPESLKDAGIMNSLAGMCLLKAVNVIYKKTRYAHKVTTAVLDILRKKSLLQVLVTSSEVSGRHFYSLRQIESVRSTLKS